MEAINRTLSEIIEDGKTTPYNPNENMSRSTSRSQTNLIQSQSGNKLSNKGSNKSGENLKNTVINTVPPKPKILPLQVNGNNKYQTQRLVVNKNKNNVTNGTTNGYYSNQNGQYISYQQQNPNYNYYSNGYGYGYPQVDTRPVSVSGGYGATTPTYGTYGGSQVYSNYGAYPQYGNSYGNYAQNPYGCPDGSNCFGNQYGNVSPYPFAPSYNYSYNGYGYYPYGNQPFGADQTGVFSKLSNIFRATKVK